MKSVEELLSSHHRSHSKFQIENFILGSGCITSYGEYKQSLRELEGRESSIATLEAQRKWRKLLRNLWSVLFSVIGWMPVVGAFFQMKKAIHSEGYRVIVVSLAETIRERDMFWSRANELSEVIDSTDPEKLMRLETEYWEEKFYVDSVVDIISSGRVSTITIKSLLKLPRSSQNAVAGRVQDIIDNPTNLIGVMKRLPNLSETP